MSQRRHFRGAVALPLVFVLLACSNQTPSPGSGSGAPGAESGSPQAGIEPGGTFITALNSDPRTIVASIGFSEAAIVGCKIQEGLISLDPSGTEPRPELAEDWEVSDDGLTYTFQLRDDVSWHDGEPFTSADVKWTFENVTTNHPIGRQRGPHMAGIDTPDDHTVVFRLDEPWAPFMYTLGCPTGGAISAQHTVAEGVDVFTDEAFNHEPVGTGPFVFDEWVAGSTITLTRNENYWKPGLPYLDGIVFSIIPDATAMTLALRSGELNYIEAQYTQLEDVVRLQGEEGIQVFEGLEGPATLQLRLNTRQSPLDQVEVRRALYMAIDRELILENNYPVQGALPHNMIDEGIELFGGEVNPDADLTEMYPYDPQAAEEMLDEAGFERDSDGTRFELRLLYEHPRFEWNEIAQTIQANWDEIGVRVTLEPVDTATMIERGFLEKDFDTFFHIVYSFGDPAVGVSRAFTCVPEDTPVPFGNSGGYCDEEVDALFAEAARLTDPDERREVYQQLQQILAEDLPAFPIATRVTATLADTTFDYSPVFDSSWFMTGWESVYQISE